VFLTNLAFWKKKYPIAATLAIFPYLFGWIHTSMHASKVEQSPTMTVGLVQTGLLPSEKILLPGRAEEFVSPYEQWRRIATLLKGCEKKIDLVVLPEFSVPFEAHSKVYSFSVVQQILDEITGGERSIQVAEAIKVSNQFWVQTIGKLMSADVIAGLDVTDQGSHFTSAYYCPHTTEKVERYDKQVLVPLAEYVPFEWVRNLTKAYGITEFYTHGKEAKVFSSKVSFAPSICYEETFAHLMRKSRLKGANLFVNLSNDNWYPNSKLPKQHFDHARLRAVENGVPMVRACNTGITAAVDSLGRIIGQITDERRADVLVAQVPLYHYSTLYSFWGDWGIIALSLIFILICGILSRKHLTIDAKRS
jgi:apolipoprotein N-acyltransferase